MDMNTLRALLVGALSCWLRLLDLLDDIRGLLERAAQHRPPAQAESEVVIRTDVTWSPDGDLLAYGLSDGTVGVWDIPGKKLALTYCGHSDWVTSVAWSPDGAVIASAGYDGTVQLWRAASGEPLLTYRGHSDEVRHVAWSPDGRRLASAGYDRSIQIWDATTGVQRAHCQGHTNVVTSVAWSPDGAYLVTGSRDHSVRLWDATTGDELVLIEEHRGMVNDVAWAPERGRFAFASASNDCTVKVWQVEPDTFSVTCITSYERHTSTGGVVAVAWSPDGKRIVSVDRATMHEWTVHSPQASIVLPIPSPAPFRRGEVFALDSRALPRHPAYPEGTQIAIAGEGWIFLGDSPATALVEEWISQ